MNGFFRFVARRHLFANIFTLTILILGLYTVTQMKRETYPQVDFGEVHILTRYPGASPEDVEQKVTNKIEDEIDHVDGIDYYLSYSLENVSLIRAVLDPSHPNQDKVKQELREAVNRVNNYPEEVDELPTIREQNSTIIPMIHIGITGDVPYEELRTTALRLERRMKRVDGVASIERNGYREREVTIEVLPEKVLEYELSMKEVLAAIGQRNLRASGGTFESYTSQKNIVTLAEFRDPDEVGDVVVRATFEGPLIRVRDIARITYGFAEEKFLAHMNGKRAVNLTIFNTETADVIRTVDSLRTVTAEFVGHLPENIKIEFSSDQSRYVRNRLWITASNGIIGFILVIFTLTIFLKFRIAFWVAMGIPISFFGALIVFPLFDVHLDSITLSAMVLVLGVIVDDAIIVAESIYRHFESGKAPLAAAVAGMQDISKPVLTTVLTTMIAFAPMFFMEGLMGKFVAVIPIAVCLVLLFSLLECMIALPAHLVKALVKTGRTTHPKVIEGEPSRIKRFTIGFLASLYRLKCIVVPFFLLILLLTVGYAALFMEFILFPSYAADQFYILAKTTPGTSLEGTSIEVKKIEKELQKMKGAEVSSYMSNIGWTGLRARREGEEFAFISVSLTPYSQRTLTADQIVENLRRELPNKDKFSELFFWIESGGPAVERAVELRLVGGDQEMRSKFANNIIGYLNQRNDVKEIDRDDEEGKDEIIISPDYTKLARLGLTVADIAQNVRVAFDGSIAAISRYDEEDVEFRVIADDESRKQRDAIADISIPNRDNRLISLNQVATFTTGKSQSSIQHYNGDRALTIAFDVDKQKTSPLSVVAQLLERFNHHPDYPLIDIIVGGEAQESEQSLIDLGVRFLMAIVGVYLLLILLFNSAQQPILIMLTIPYSLVGVILGFYLHGESFSFTGMMGVIGLAGVVVNDGLVLVAHLNQKRKGRPITPLPVLVAEATYDRIRPILLTTITTAAGLLPLAYGIGGSDPYMTQMALALGYGLIFATPVLIILLPCFYIIGDEMKSFFTPDANYWVEMGDEDNQL